MKSEFRSFTLLAIMLLAGCASKPVIMHKDHATVEEFDKDQYRCAQETADAGNYRAFGSPLFVAMAADAARKNRRQMFRMCMAASGWHVVPKRKG